MATSAPSTGSGRSANRSPTRASVAPASEIPFRPRSSSCVCPDAASGGDMRRGVLAVPGDRPLEPLAKVGLRAEAEELLGARHVQAPPRLPVRLRLVPDDLAF